MEFMFGLVVAEGHSQLVAALFWVVLKWVVMVTAAVKSYFASSSSSILSTASVSYLALHWTTSLLALDSALCSSALASCSSSSCSLSKLQSCRDACTAWASATRACGTSSGCQSAPWRLDLPCSSWRAVKTKPYLASFLKLPLQILCVLTKAEFGALQLSNRGVPLLQVTTVLVWERGRKAEAVWHFLLQSF